MFQLASTIPDKEILWKSKPKSSIFIKNLTRVPLKRKNLKIVDLMKSFFLLNIISRSRQ